MAQEPVKHRCIAAVRIRGTISASRQARETLEMLRLTRNNYAVLIDDRPSYLGMLKAARDYVTYGEASKELVTIMIKEKGRVLGNKRLIDDYAQKAGFGSLDKLAEAVHSCRIEYWKLPRIQPVFRLHPPSKGFKGKIKRGYGSGGELGYRGEGINELLGRML